MKLPSAITSETESKYEMMSGDYATSQPGITTVSEKLVEILKNFCSVLFMSSYYAECFREIFLFCSEYRITTIYGMMRIQYNKRTLWQVFYVLPISLDLPWVPPQKRKGKSVWIADIYFISGLHVVKICANISLSGGWTVPELHTRNGIQHISKPGIVKWVYLKFKLTRILDWTILKSKCENGEKLKSFPAVATLISCWFSCKELLTL